MKHRAFYYWPTLTLVILYVGILSTAAVVLLALARAIVDADGRPSALSVLGLPAIFWPSVALALALFGLAWMIRIFRGPRDEPPPWRYRDPAPSERLAAVRRRVAEGPSVEERRRFWLRDLALASMPSLVLLFTWAIQPDFGGGMHDPPPMVQQALTWAAFGAPLVGQWIAALLAVRARTAVRRAGWAIVWALCVGGWVFSPALALIAINLFGG